MNEFNLSEKVHYPNECFVCKIDDFSKVYFESDVKEFIRLLKELYFIDNKVLFADIILKIDELAGERLK